MTWFNKIKLAIVRNRRLFGISFTLGLTSSWAIFEPFVTIIYPEINKYVFLPFYLVLAFVTAIYRAFPPNELQIPFHNTNTIVNLKFGDIFKQQGTIAISVNEFFDSEIGKPVSAQSLHGILIQKVLGGKNDLFDNSIANSLQNVPFEEVHRQFGKSRKYPIGTTAVIEFGGVKYLPFVLSKTNAEFVASTTPSLMLEALEGMFNKARAECNGGELNIPLIGGGLSRSGIPQRLIIELILIAILKSTKKNEITGVINIVIHPLNFDLIDLKEVKRKWQ